METEPTSLHFWKRVTRNSNSLTSVVSVANWGEDEKCCSQQQQEPKKEKESKSTRAEGRKE
jgi:hypothetical protein